MSKLKSNLHEILADRNLKPADLVKLTGLPQPTVSRILKGEQDNPTLSTLTALAKGLEVPLGPLARGRSRNEGGRIGAFVEKGTAP